MNGLPAGQHSKFLCFILKNVNMAEQKSFIKLQGTLGGLTFYEKEGKSLVKTAGGVTRERILKDPNYIRTRENMREFGAAARIGRSLRIGLNNLVQEVSSPNLTARVTGQMKRINKVGTGDRGGRSFEILTNRQLLEGFELQPALPLRNVFFPPFQEPTIDANRSVVTWEVPDFNTQNYIKIPNGASHARLVLNTCVLSDYELDTSLNAYAFVHPAENERSATTFSQEFALSGMVGSSLSLNTDLGLTAALPNTAGVVVALGILFYQVINGNYYGLTNNNAVQIYRVL